MDNLNKLTILLTIKDRVEFTFRWLQSMQEQKCPYPILIANGGQDKRLNQSIFDYIKKLDLNISYIEYPPDINLTFFLKKLINAMSRVTTEYIILADNDDFYDVANLAQLIYFLDTSASYSAARGKLINFEIFTQSGNSKGVCKGKYYEAYEVFSPSIDDTEGDLRIKLLFEGMSKFDYYANWYSVVRHKDLIRIWREILTLGSNDMILMEIVFHLRLVDLGKIKILPLNHYYRQRNTSQHGDTLVQNNIYLEKLIEDNSLMRLNFAINNLLSSTTDSRIKIIIESVSFWHRELISNILKSQKLGSSYFLNLRNFIRRSQILKSFFQIMNSYAKKVIWKQTNIKSTRMDKFHSLIINK